MTSEWVSQVLARSFGEVAQALGLEQRPSNSWTPCPSCDADQRGSQDRRGPIGVTHDEQGWRCHRCQAGGSSLSLIAWHVLGDPSPIDKTRWGEVREWCSDRGWCDRFERRRRHPPVTRASALARPVPRIPQRPPQRPPSDQVLELWRACRPVTDDVAVAAWLRDERGLDPTVVEDLDLARALVGESSLPPWARTARGPWSASGHSLISPLFDHRGALVSLRARAVTPQGPRDLKALAPSGFQVRGLVLADGLAQLLLLGSREAAELVRDVGLVIAEGEPDMLTWATRWGVDGGLETAPAVLGLVAGSWTDEIAARVPDGTRVAARTHDDDAGDRYANRIEQTLGRRCRVLRPAKGAT